MRSCFFFHHKASPFVRKVLLVIEELAVPVVERQVDFQDPAAMEGFARINPNRRFPALRHGDLRLWESNAILRYLAALHDPRWLGTTPAAAAVVDQWLCWELAHLGPALLGLQNLRLGFLPRPALDEAALRAGQDRLLSVLDAQLAAHPFLAGETITVADLAVAAMFSFAEEAGLVDAPLPHLRRWLASMTQRPSWQSTERMKRDALAAYGITLPPRPPAQG
jgi:glutathione S-transferase